MSLKCATAEVRKMQTVNFNFFFPLISLLKQIEELHLFE